MERLTKLGKLILIGWLLVLGSSYGLGEERIHQITKENFWSLFKGTYNNPTIDGYVKFSILVKKDGSLDQLIFHPKSFKYHADHLTTLDEFKGLSPAQIDKIAFYNVGRKLLLGTVLFVKGDKSAAEIPWRWDIQLLSHDPLVAPYVKEALDLLKAPHALQLEALKYAPVMEQKPYVKENLDSFSRAGIEISFGQSVEGRICYTDGWTVGRVRVLSNKEFEKQMEQGAISDQDILVLESVPRELPIVAGIIVSETSSPSSHPALLAEMLGIPFFYHPQ